MLKPVLLEERSAESVSLLGSVEEKGGEPLCGDGAWGGVGVRGSMLVRPECLESVGRDDGCFFLFGGKGEGIVPTVLAVPKDTIR